MHLTYATSVTQRFNDFIKETQHNRLWDIDWRTLLIRIDECPWIGVKLENWC
jgi:hypothetical protein